MVVVAVLVVLLLVVLLLGDHTIGGGGAVDTQHETIYAYSAFSCFFTSINSISVHIELWIAGHFYETVKLSSAFICLALVALGSQTLVCSGLHVPHFKMTG